ncbi:MAG TPA: helix-turn-helix domain-containing protein [Polyangiaceae bacterium]|nr:helix-turn-helix domain-containing protein [Polyangiaceae bacterium]
MSEVQPRIARRERRRERSREEIVAAARRVLLRNGIAATTLDAVAEEVGLSKAALYYYYPSKDALLFEIVFSTIEAQSRAVHDAVAEAKDGGDALRAIVRETVHTFASRLDDFRLVFLQGQVAGPGAVRVGAEQLARIRPLNELAYGDAAKMLAEDSKRRRGRAHVEPRMMAFLANVAAIGLLTMKGMVESVGDPLLYSDEQLIEGLARIFEAAAAP